MIYDMDIDRANIKYLEEEKVFEQLDRIRAERNENIRMNLSNLYSIISGQELVKLLLLENIKISIKNIIKLLILV